MGLLDFAQDVGRRLFDGDGEAAKSIKEHLEVKTTGLSNLEVEFDDGIATISGDCDSAATKDLAVLIAGDVQGVRAVNADGLRAPEPTPVEEKVTYHVVESGDTLGGISKKYYGKSSKYMQIFEANRGLLSDPNKIYPGQRILIPADE
jgi:nucleoid-associated protein YgaU